MANSIDTVLESLRQLAGGAAQFAKNREGRLDREAAYGAKKDQAEAERKRLEAAGLEADAIAKEYEADPENFDTKRLAKVSTNFRKVAGGDAALNTMIDDFRAAAENVEKNKRATATATASAVKSSKKDERDAKAEERQGRQELDSIAKAYGDEDQTKSLVKVRQAYNRIDAATDGEPNGIKDIGAVTAYMKSIDEGSTVRETEFKTAAEARSFWSKETKTDENGNLTTKNGVPIPSFLAAAIQKFTPDKNGAFLLPEQRLAMKEAAEESYRRQLQQQGPIDERYKKRLESMGEKDYSKAIPGFAADELKTLDSKKEERRRRKEAEDKVSLTPTGDGKKKSTAKVMDEKTFQEFFEMNKPAVTAAFQAAEKRLGRPLTPEEKQTQINALIKAAEVQTAPKGK